MKRASAIVAALSLCASLDACSSEPPSDQSYFNENIRPVLQASCVQQTTGCHLARPDGTAAGNLDLSSYDALMRRQDVLPAYGPYPVGLLLLKSGAPVEIQVDTFDAPDPARPDDRFVRVTTDIRHDAGSTVSLASSGYSLIKRWIDAGHTRTGVAPTDIVRGGGACRHGAGVGFGFDPAAPPADMTSFDNFTSNVWPVLAARCAGSTCHSAPVADFYLSCGETDEEKRWNYFVAVAHVNAPAVQSEILRRPLSTLRGGTFHEGGDVFPSADDGDYQTIRTWAEDLVARRPDLVRDEMATPGLRFFANRVQPVLVRKGCMFLNCHSAAMFHDLRLRTGSQGTFSRVATRRNYELSHNLLAIESTDPNDSRIIAKNLFPPDQIPGADGISHRGGSLFEDFSTGGAFDPATVDNCMGVDADNGDLNTVPAYCVLARWHQIEREDAIMRGELQADVVSSVVWVARPPGVGSVLDFDRYEPGADLRMADATVAADSSLSLAGSRSLLAGCGLSSATADVRTPAVSWDATRIAFAARSSAAEPLRLYWMGADGSGCVRVPDVAPAMDSENGILTHDFDPAFAPDGRMVFASTRGNLDRSFPWQGPTRTPAAMTPNSNLYVYEPMAAQKVRQLTYLLNQELAPAFMGDGRVIFTAEKRAPEFHQLAVRRQNLDGGDYHPLLAQRQSIGFDAATEVAEMTNRNFAFVAAPLGTTDGAGAIAFMNRSLGPDQNDRDPADRVYLHSVRMPTPGAFGGMTGAFRSPAALPTGRVLASCDLGAMSLTGGPFDFDLCELDPATGATRVVAGDAGVADVEAVAVYARPNRGVFVSRTDEANGHTRVEPGANDAEVRVQDLPMIATLLFNNTRTGRPIDPRIQGLDVLGSYPPPASATTFDDVAGQVVTDAFGRVFTDYHMLGNVPLYGDGSLAFRYRGGMPIVLRPTDESGHSMQFPAGGPFTGDVIQREEMQFYPGERAHQSLQRRFFNGLCGGCHGAITGRELDIAVNIDVLTSASVTDAYQATPTDLFQ